MISYNLTKTMTPPHGSDPAAIAEYLIPRIDRALAIFRLLKYLPTAAPSYELLSDTIYWEDEVPPDPDSDVLAIIRHILRTRIELAHSSGNDPTWNHFKKHVPNWLGFRPERSGNALLKLYVQGRSDKQLADE